MTTLTHLGKTSPIENDPAKVVLDRIPNPEPELLYCARFTVPEFSSLCPVTGQPDFATLVIDYVPYRYLLESKSLKLYIFAFRDVGSFHESCTLSIGKRLYDELEPHWLRIAGYFNARGNIPIDVFWQHGVIPTGCLVPELEKREFRAAR